MILIGVAQHCIQKRGVASEIITIIKDPIIKITVDT